MGKHLQVLIVEDFESDALLVARALSKAGFTVHHERVDSAEALQDALERQHWDVVVSDFSMPAFGALPALTIIRQSGQRIPVFVVTSRADEETAVAVIKAGAQDYLRKDHLSKLGDAVRRELAAQAASPDGHTNLRQALESILAEADSLLLSALPHGVLHTHARRLRQAAATTLSALDQQ